MSQAHQALNQLVEKLPSNLSHPFGVLDVVDERGIWGWACDVDGPSQSLQVRIYADGPEGTGSFVQSAVANLNRESAIADLCGGYADHGFNIPIPSRLKDGRPHNIYVYANNIGPWGNNALLFRSPMTLSPTSAQAAIAVGTSGSFTADSARAYPVPIRPGHGGAAGITFDRIPEGTPILIFNVENQLTKTLTTKYPGEAFWDLTNTEGASVPSGIYSAVIEVAGAKKRLKLVVQR